MHEALIACRLVHFTTLFALFGTGAFRVYGLAVAPTAAVAAFDRWFARFALLSAFVTLLSAAAILVATTATMAGSIAAATEPAMLATVLLQTEFGHVWCGRLVLALMLVAACIALPPRRWNVVVLILSGLLLVSLGWVGHAAMDQGTLRVAHEVNQMAHLLAGAFWLGGLLPLAWFLARLRRMPDGEWLALGREMLPRFSQMGYGAVAILALTGAANSVLLVGSPAALVGTPYGRLLIVKIILFLAMVTLASVNRFRLMPQIARQPEPSEPLSALARSVLAEQALALAILVVVSMLGTFPPAIHFGHH